MQNARSLHTGFDPHLLQCMNRVYLRGCEAKYLEPLLSTSDFCEKPPANSRRLDQDADGAERHAKHQMAPGTSGALAETPLRMPASDSTRAAVVNSRTRLRQSGSYVGGPGLSLSTKPRGDDDRTIRSRFDRDAKGGAGSLVIHIRSGDIFLTRNVERMKIPFPGYGQVRRPRPHVV